MNRYNASLRLWQEASSTLVPGSATISKDPRLATFGAYPIYAERAEGAELTDIDGNRYIDCGSALGAVILGYNHPRVQAAVENQLAKGSLFSLSTPTLVPLTKLISTLVPSMKRVRVVKNGSDATSAAARIARACTGRSKIAVAHFHGWHDWFYVTTPLRRGIPESFAAEVLPFPYNDLGAVQNLIAAEGPNIAAFLLEPAHIEEPLPEYLEMLRNLAHANGSLLIFDEVVTGFRYAAGGAQEYFRVAPDLTCIGKALGNGFPIAAVGGAAAYMDASSTVITSMTYGEEALSIAAAIATLELLREEPISEHLWREGAYFKAAFNALSTRYDVPIRCLGYPVRMDLAYADSGLGERKVLKSFFLQETAKRGVLIGGHLFISFSHSRPLLERVLSVCEEVFMLLTKRRGITRADLEGSMTEELW